MFKNFEKFFLYSVNGLYGDDDNDKDEVLDNDKEVVFYPVVILSLGNS